MESTAQLHSYYQSLSREAEQLAGGLNDLGQRATVYHHLFEHSGRNHIFPLIAAHGALWARAYFRFGMRLGWCCSWQYAASPDCRRTNLVQLAAFADAFRDINRRVCIDTYVSYHFTARFGDHPDAGEFVPPPLLDALARCHAARRAGRELAAEEKRSMFQAFFLNEQQTIVGQSIDAATAAFDWPLIKSLALRPVIRFAYFPGWAFLGFRNFARTEERIENGLRAFDLGARVGWDHVEAALRRYAVLPEEFFANSARHFAFVREAVLARSLAARC